ncbi:hypothetical protein CAPTEDRAFT_192673 [Capitella teleta]|uniref:Uncharacterized protein n=1 Tax=Capitella teleta TaxID=283909 RepID=R7TRA3_CAPTE|nr:hypothetical protein CAPTEDRAFT_192673 [Capitella teleta]|eukprot:ELT96433.1 hypothetical protein CAPTEDRAFT_192673 [Capitella teleta]
MLHYAVFANSVEIVKLLVDKPCKKSARDKRRRTPRSFAKELGYVDIIGALGGPITRPRRPLYQCKTPIKLMEIPPSRTPSVPKQEMKLGEFCAAVLNSPVTGIQHYASEVDEIKEELLKFMEKLSESCCNYCPPLAFTPKLRGSVAEKTKVGRPDEFDVLLLLEEFGRSCEFHDPNDVLRIGSYVRVINTSPLVELNAQRLEISQVASYPLVLVRRIRILFFTMISTVLTGDVLTENNIWESSPFKFIELRFKSVAATLHMSWNGPSYKRMNISVDLVPGFPIDYPWPMTIITNAIDWPISVDFTDCRLIILLNNIKTNYEFAELSYSDFEERIMQHLPSSAKEGYIIAKSILSLHISHVHNRYNELFMLNDHGPMYYEARDIISSYMLKNALLHEVRLEIERGGQIQLVAPSTWAWRTFAHLAESFERKELQTVCGYKNLLADKPQGDNFIARGQNVLRVIGQVVPWGKGAKYPLAYTQF